MTCPIVLRCLLGFIWSLGFGYLAAWLVVNRLRAHLAARRASSASSSASMHAALGVPTWLTGMIERLFFTTAVAFDLSGTATAMMAWIGLKMAADWYRQRQPEEPRPDPPGALSAALGSLVSMLFALTGGEICRGRIWF